MICRTFHRRRWRLVAASLTTPIMWCIERHVGVYECERCRRRHRIVGDMYRNDDVHRPAGGPPPARGLAMSVHIMLGGSTAGPATCE